MAATGVDLSEEIVDTRRGAVRYVQPSALLRERLAAQSSQGSLPPTSVGGTLVAGGIGFSALPASRRRALKPGKKE
jgi:hypothetical protein